MPSINVQGWGIHWFSETPLPVPYHPHSNKLLPNFQSNPSSVSLKPFLLVLPQHAMVEGPSPAFLQAPFRYWRDTIWVGSFHVLSPLAHEQRKNRLMPAISGQPVQRKTSGKADGHIFLAWLAGWVLTAQKYELLSWVRCVWAATSPCMEDIL